MPPLTARIILILVYLSTGTVHCTHVIRSENASAQFTSIPTEYTSADYILIFRCLRTLLLTARIIPVIGYLSMPLLTARIVPLPRQDGWLSG